VKRFLVAMLVLAAFAAVGVATGSVLLSNQEIRHLIAAPPDTPDPVAWFFAAEEPQVRRVVPLEEMGPMKGPNRFQRPSWEGVDSAPRPADPRTDPLHGTTQVMFFHTALETRLSSILRQARLPLRVLRLGIEARVPAASTRAGQKTLPHGLCYIEIYCGDPPAAPAIEETADRAIQLAFAGIPHIAEVDLVAVPWRTAPGHKPPIRFSVDAHRASYVGIAGARSHMANLRTCGAVWVDPRVMSDFP
jgi:hypothetical protein